MFVYAVLNKSCSAIKIGYSSNPTQRLSQLQVSSPTPLELKFLYPNSGKETEQMMHKILKIKEMHFSGEWFKWNKIVKEYLKDILIHIDSSDFTIIEQHKRSWWEAEKICKT